MKKIGLLCLALCLKELAEGIKGQHSSLKVQDDIKMSQEIQANDPMYTICFGNSVGKNFNILHLGVSQAKRLESDFGNKMGLGRVPKGKAKGKMKNAKVRGKNQKWALSKPADFYILNCNFDFLSLNFNLVSSVAVLLPSPSLVCHQYRLHTNDDIGFCGKIPPGQQGWGYGLEASPLWGDLAYQPHILQIKATHPDIASPAQECLSLPFFDYLATTITQMKPECQL